MRLVSKQDLGTEYEIKSLESDRVTRSAIAKGASASGEMLERRANANSALRLVEHDKLQLGTQLAMKHK